MSEKWVRVGAPSQLTKDRVPFTNSLALLAFDPNVVNAVVVDSLKQAKATFTGRDTIGYFETNSRRFVAKA